LRRTLAPSIQALKREICGPLTWAWRSQRDDFGVKLERAIEFLCDDIKVRLKLRFKGRQKAHKEFGFEVMNRFVREAAAYGPIRRRRCWATAT
jgi:translation initiation factor IF-3